MLQFPIHSYKDNVVYTHDSEAWSYYRLHENTVGINEQEAEDNLVNRLQRLAWQLASFEEIDYKILPIPVDIDKRMDSLKEQYEGKYADIGHYYAERAAEILREEAKHVVEYKFFVGIKLKKRETEENLIDAFSSSFKSMNRYLQKLAGFRESEVDDLTSRLFEESEEDAYTTLNNYLGAYRLKEKELRYLIRHQFVRGQEQTGNEESLYSLTEGILDPGKAGYLHIKQLENESWCAFLPVSDFPIDLRYKEWAYFFQSYHFPVEVNMRTVYKKRKEDENQTNTIKKRFRDQDAQLIEANEDDDSLINTGRELLHQLENEIRNQGKPLLRTHIHFVVYGQTKEEVRKRARRLKSDFKDQQIEIEQPLADQLLLFHQSLPAAKITAEDWEQILTPESFAESLFSLTRKIGNTVGFYLGKNISHTGESIESSQSLVFYHPFLAHLGLKGSKYSSPHVTISGPTGMGKSYLLKDILLNAVFFGAKVLMTDPKNEVEKKFKQALTPEMEQSAPFFKELIESFNYITLSSEKKDAGKLDPLTFLEGEEAQDAAVGVLEYLSELQSNERNVKTAIYKGVRHVLQQDEKPGLLKVVRYLQDSDDPEVQNVGDLLYEIGTNGVAKLMFSEGDAAGISLHEQVNILQIQNLNLPAEGEKAATRDEHIAVALMQPLAKFATKFARDDSVIKMTIFEEAWMLMNTGAGDRLINELLRTGRSLRSAVYIITQSTYEYNKPQIKENIGTKFAFKAKTTEEAASIIEFLGMEDNKANRDMLKNLSEGQCIVEDMYGRTAKIQIDVLFDEWISAFNTKENDRGRAETEEAFM
ncbi:ATP-binding protein [Bacillus sp. ISL-47]|uniref:ATP-binding protein n=1 Tax=Bacillus sp. ISL-47 TaxID=2819130 RepID=UPI001BE79198|nr:ATP-binding protein [Bacillus sp. ISL-47]MBT2688356.1 ATP-binding protein [Bacillus sp. ISL-47]MBT2710533.1 ATP-binding protein [Pseudomonas sp. ISL-84]